MLAYEVVLRDDHATPPFEEHAFVSAQDGTLLDHWDAVESLTGKGKGFYSASIELSTKKKGLGAVLVDTNRGDLETLDAMNGAFAMVAGDTGLLHLAAAVGLPVVGLFGPTTSTDGFWCHDGVALELPLACRPCSRFGGARCPMGDHLCLQGIEVERVVRAVAGLR